MSNELKLERMAQTFGVSADWLQHLESTNYNCTCSREVCCDSWEAEIRVKHAREELDAALKYAQRVKAAEMTSLVASINEVQT